MLIFVVVREPIQLQVEATLSSCGASVSPHDVNPGTTTNFSFSVDNTSGNDITWVRFSRPSGDVSIVNYEVTGWSLVSSSASEYVFNNGSIGSGGSHNFTLQVNISGNATGTNNWGVQASDASDGNGAISCTGDLSMSMPGSSSDTTPPAISNLTLSNVTETSATFSWNTDEAANAVVEYGPTGAYGSSSTDSSLATSHSITLTGLSSNTSYHYRIKSTDGSNNTTQSNDNTFATASTSSGPSPTPVVVTVTTTTTTIEYVSSTTPTPTVVVDTVAPVILVDDIFKTIYPKSPVITGSVTDSSGIDEIEYSVDDGTNWLPVTLATRAKTKQTFSFTPVLFDEGDYEIVVRAGDAIGNTGYSKKYTLRIDRLPPQVGSMLSSIGPQVLFPDENGIVHVLSGMKQRITVSAVGGPTSLTLQVKNNGSRQTISLVRDRDRGLWSGTVAFDHPGIHEMTIEAVDNAAKQTRKTLSPVVVLKPGQITANAASVEGAIVELYVKDVTTNSWQRWDGKPFGQTNPQKTDKNGYYHLFPPPGTYYIKIQAKGYQPLTSEIFSLSAATPLNAGFTLNQKASITVGPLQIPLPDILLPSAPVSLSVTDMVTDRHILLNEEAPVFSLKTVTGGEFSSYSLRGKSSSISFINTWSPASFEQISLLNGQQNDSANDVIILSEETQARAQVFQKKGNYQLPFLFDPDGTLVEPYRMSSVPVHYILDKKGVVRRVINGVVTPEELAEIRSQYD